MTNKPEQSQVAPVGGVNESQLTVSTEEGEAQQKKARQEESVMPGAEGRGIEAQHREAELKVSKLTKHFSMDAQQKKGAGQKEDVVMKIAERELKEAPQTGAAVQMPPAEGEAKDAQVEDVAKGEAKKKKCAECKVFLPEGWNKGHWCNECFVKWRDQKYGVKRRAPSSSEQPASKKSKLAKVKASKVEEGNFEAYPDPFVEDKKLVAIRTQHKEKKDEVVELEKIQTKLTEKGVNGYMKEAGEKVKASPEYIAANNEQKKATDQIKTLHTQKNNKISDLDIKFDVQNKNLESQKEAKIKSAMATIEEEFAGKKTDLSNKQRAEKQDLIRSFDPKIYELEAKRDRAKTSMELIVSNAETTAKVEFHKVLNETQSHLEKKKPELGELKTNMDNLEATNNQRKANHDAEVKRVKDANQAEKQRIKKEEDERARKLKMKQKRITMRAINEAELSLEESDLGNYNKNEFIRIVEECGSKNDWVKEYFPKIYEKLK